jgi:hypothetical protein
MAISDIPRSFDDGTFTTTDDGANSATIEGITGTYTLSNVYPDGREPIIGQTQGAVSAARRGNRVFPTISIQGQARRFDTDAHKIVYGTIAGYVSVLADIGDQKGFDLQLDEDYSTDTRQILAEDCTATMEYTQSEGEIASFSIEITVHGPLTIDGVTYIASR